jgi:hypothetical protein
MNSEATMFGKALMSVVLFIAVSAVAPLGGQTKWTPAHTPDGQPDLQGVWSFATITPLERPAELAGKQFFTEKEAVEYEKEVLKRTNRDRRDGPADADVSRAYNDFWWDSGNKVVTTRRTSLIIDPPDGKLPALTPAGQKRTADRAEARRLRPYDGPEDRPLAERCLVWGTAGPPILPSAYNNNIRIVQGTGYVALLNEMIHDVRIIPLDGRPHLPKNVRSWMGDSRGHWEGNTLVVDTTNFSDRTNFRGADENLHLIERFTRASDNTLIYQFTVDNETAFTRSWTAEVPMTKSQNPMFEYACNEGNYSLLNVLAGARAEDKAAAAK